MSSKLSMTRREALGAAAGAVLAGALSSPSSAQEPKKMAYRHSVCKWCYPNISLEELCKSGSQMGLASVELLGENDWAVCKKYGLTCAMANGPSGITDGWNRPADHDKLVKESERLLPLVKAAGLPNMIVFSGNRRGISDADGLVNCEK